MKFTFGDPRCRKLPVLKKSSFEKKKRDKVKDNVSEHLFLVKVLKHQLFFVYDLNVFENLVGCFFVLGREALNVQMSSYKIEMQ